jgi:hypothetical protein
MRDIVAASIFRLIQIALVPVAAVGYVLWVVKIIKFSRDSGASAKVPASLYTRWMHRSLGAEIIFAAIAIHALRKSRARCYR